MPQKKVLEGTLQGPKLLSRGERTEKKLLKFQKGKKELENSFFIEYTGVPPNLRILSSFEGFRCK